MNFKAENKRIAGLIKAGLEKLELGDVGAAFLDFESALLFDDENFAANSLAAICLTRLDRSAEAEPLALKAIALAPGLAIPHLIAAEVLASINRHAEAEFQLFEAISKEPYNVVLRIELAWFLILAERPQEACDHLARALDISPNEPRGRLLLALALAQQKRWIEADDEIKSLSNLEKVDPGMLALAGWLRMIRAHDLQFTVPKLEEYKRAEELLKRANLIDPSIDFARELLAACSEAVERVSKPSVAKAPPPRRLRAALIALVVVIYVVAFWVGFLWVADRNFSAAMLGALGVLALYVVLLVVAGFLRRDFSFLPSSLFMFIDRTTNGWLTRWSSSVVTELFARAPASAEFNSAQTHAGGGGTGPKQS